jgi:hypothetical protein
MLIIIIIIIIITDNNILVSNVALVLIFDPRILRLLRTRMERHSAIY